MILERNHPATAFDEAEVRMLLDGYDIPDWLESILEALASRRETKIRYSFEGAEDVPSLMLDLQSVLGWDYTDYDEGAVLVLPVDQWRAWFDREGELTVVVGPIPQSTRTPPGQ